jgi:flagellar M-ring protein FliF
MTGFPYLQPSSGKPVVDGETPNESLLSINNLSNPLFWVIVAGVVLLLILIVLIFVIRKRKRESVEEEEYVLDMFNQPIEKISDLEDAEVDLSEFNTKANPKRKTIEKLATGRPEDFAKLLRTWMADE